MSNNKYKPPGKARIILWLIAAILSVYVLIFHGDKSVKHWVFGIGPGASTSAVYMKYNND